MAKEPFTFIRLIKLPELVEGGTGIGSKHFTAMAGQRGIQSRFRRNRIAGYRETKMLNRFTQFSIFYLTGLKIGNGKICCASAGLFSCLEIVLVVEITSIEVIKTRSLKFVVHFEVVVVAAGRFFTCCLLPFDFGTSNSSSQDPVIIFFRCIPIIRYVFILLSHRLS